MVNENSDSQTSQTTSVESAEAIISITGMHKWFDDFHVLKDIDLEVGRGERIVICGPSGSGKSTLIRCINRLEDHQQGTIIVDGTERPMISRTSRSSAPRSAWCFSNSTCFRT